MNNNLLQMLSSLFSSGANPNLGNFFGQNLGQNQTFSQNQNFMQNNERLNQNNQSSSVYGQSFPDEAYQNQSYQNQPAQDNMVSPNMLSMILSMLGKNPDLSSLVSAFSTPKTEEQKKSSPTDDEIII